MLFTTGMSEKRTAADIYPIVEWVTLQFELENYDRVDIGLQNLDLTLPALDLMCWVRTTYPARNKLSHWHQAVADIRAALDNRGENGQRMLRGLIDVE